ncbi:response regulator [Sphaerospermopsis aphanizomenoides BCCUSP55]|uniref:response regulator n=1 Tax=Sphaerospermopsis aphanizomenoides TaxID=459663 RepID=UPI001904C718|nr:response regulator [Sphaerospermopsis aphanizomenoides]MBK1990674.1 response regulator [Sphaerospermopsis aphanizomenoides BCCUSP55]
MIDSSPSLCKQTPLLLVVEDSNEDFEALQRLVNRLPLVLPSERSPIIVPIKRCVNGNEALAFLYRTGQYAGLESGSYPSLIILDLNLPGTDGRQILRQIKQDCHLKTIPVVIFTTSNNPKDINECYQYGANSYIVKPIDFTRLKHDIQTILDYWFAVTTLPNCLDEAGVRRAGEQG